MPSCMSHADHGGWAWLGPNVILCCLWGVSQVEELLFDQQHQIDLLMRGQFSLRGSMETMRRTHKEVEAQNQELQQQLQEQHGAALRCGQCC